MSKRKGKGRKVYSIVVDGKTEAWYLQMLKKNERLKNVKIKPDLPKKSKFSDLYKYVKEQSKYYDKVIWIIDLDTTIAEAKQKNELKSKMQEVQRCLRDLERDRVIVIINCPCLEEWILLHFENSSRYYSLCGKIESVLRQKKYLPEYEKSEQYYKATNNDIYYRLKGYLQNAMENSKNLGAFDKDNPESAVSEMYKIFDFLKID